MKLWSRLCFLVLAVSSLSRGQNDTATVPPQNQENGDETDPAGTLTPGPGNETIEADVYETSPPSPLNQTSQNATDVFTTTVMAPVETTATTPKGDSGSTAAQTTAPADVPGGQGGGGDGGDKTTTVSVKATSNPPMSGTTEDNHSSWGYVILVLIILVIIALCVILYILRRVSRTYSFDLQRPVPVNDLSEPTGTFEPVYLDDLDRPAPKEQTTPDDLSPPPVTNGAALTSEEKSSTGENAPQEQPDANGVETSNTCPSLGDDPADKTSSPLGSTNLLFDAIGEEQQNENNNNPSVCSSDPFVEINLDDPAWFTSPDAPSSVLPFSPFSFSSSTSSSS